MILGVGYEVELVALIVELLRLSLPFGFLVRVLGPLDVTRAPVTVDEAPGAGDVHRRPRVPELCSLYAHAWSVSRAFRETLYDLAVQTSVTIGENKSKTNISAKEYTLYVFMIY